MEEKAVIKKIELEMYFEADFVPPKRFDKALCSGKCPFLSCDFESSEVWCCVTAVRDPVEECPLRKYFEKLPPGINGESKEK